METVHNIPRSAHPMLQAKAAAAGAAKREFEDCLMAVLMGMGLEGEVKKVDLSDFSVVVDSGPRLVEKVESD